MAAGRRKYIWRNGAWAELDLNAPLPPRKTPYFMRDLADYQSMVTGEMITSRSRHREHLREHGCIEVGNEMQMLRPEAPSPVRDDLVAALQASPETHAEARVAAEAASEAGPVERILS